MEPQQPGSGVCNLPLWGKSAYCQLIQLPRYKLVFNLFHPSFCDPNHKLRYSAFQRGAWPGDPCKHRTWVPPGTLYTCGSIPSAELFCSYWERARCPAQVNMRDKVSFHSLYSGGCPSEMNTDCLTLQVRKLGMKKDKKSV